MRPKLKLLLFLITRKLLLTIHELLKSLVEMDESVSLVSLSLIVPRMCDSSFSNFSKLLFTIFSLVYLGYTALILAYAIPASVSRLEQFQDPFPLILGCALWLAHLPWTDFLTTLRLNWPDVRRITI